MDGLALGDFALEDVDAKWIEAIPAVA